MSEVDRAVDNVGGVVNDTTKKVDSTTRKVVDSTGKVIDKTARFVTDKVSILVIIIGDFDMNYYFEVRMLSNMKETILNIAYLRRS